MVTRNRVGAYNEPAFAGLGDGALIGHNVDVLAGYVGRAHNIDILIRVLDGHIAGTVEDIPKHANIRAGIARSSARALDGNGRFCPCGCAAGQAAGKFGQGASYKAVVKGEAAALILDDDVASLQVEVTGVGNIHGVDALGLQTACAGDLIGIDGDVAAGNHDVRQVDGCYIDFIQDGTVVFNEPIGFHQGLEFFHFCFQYVVFVGSRCILADHIGQFPVAVNQGIGQGYAGGLNTVCREPVAALGNRRSNTAPIQGGFAIYLSCFRLSGNGQVQIRMDAGRHRTSIAQGHVVVRGFTAGMAAQGRRGGGACTRIARVVVVFPGAFGDCGQPLSGFQIGMADRADVAVDEYLVGLGHGVFQAGTAHQRQSGLVISISQGGVIEHGPQTVLVGAGVEIDVVHAFHQAAGEADGVGPVEIIDGFRRSGPYNPALGVGHGLEGTIGGIRGGQGNVLVRFARLQGSVGGAYAVGVGHVILAVG